MDKISAANAIRTLAVQFAAMTEAAEILERIGSAENAEREVKTRVEKMRADEAAAQADLERARAEAKAERERNARLRETTEAEIEQWKTKAADEANALTELTKKQAQEIVAGAQQKAEAIAVAARAKVVEAEGEANAAATRLAELEAEITGKTAELTELEGRLALAREAAKKILG